MRITIWITILFMGVAIPAFADLARRTTADFYLESMATHSGTHMMTAADARAENYQSSRDKVEAKAVSTLFIMPVWQ